MSNYAKGGLLVEALFARRVFRTLFQELYGIAEPLLPLKNVLHWADLVRRLGVAETSVDHAITYVFGGYFYNTTTPVPSVAEIEEQFAFGRARGATQFLVPTVRNALDAGPLRALGFEPIPWVVKSIFELRQGAQADLNSRLGRHRARSIERVAEKAEARYSVRYYERAEIEADPTVLATAAALHECNVLKYGHARNFYSTPLLRQLFASVLGEHLLIGIRRNKTTGEVVQASISLIDRRHRRLYWLVQGICREKVAPGINLFIADAYQLLTYAERNGIREINLSRGGQEQKLLLGANRFHLLNNWILSLAPGAAMQLDSIAARCRMFLALEDGRAPTIGAYRLQ